MIVLLSNRLDMARIDQAKVDQDKRDLEQKLRAEIDNAKVSCICTEYLGSELLILF